MKQLDSNKEDIKQLYNPINKEKTSPLTCKHTKKKET